MPTTPKGSRLIIHIGTGKTATTSLQQDIFPLLHSKKKIAYLNAINSDIHSIQRLYFLSRGFKKNFLRESIINIRDRISKSINSYNITHLISLEALHGWDPATWEDYLGFNKELFSGLAESVEIIISVRSTKPYLDSVYMQMVHEGRTYLTPETFFLQSDAYEMAKRYLGEHSQGSEIFCIDKLIYKTLFEIYCNNFDACYCFTMEEIISLEFLKELKLHDNILQAKQLSKHLSIHNKSYSDTAYRLTLAREKVLNKFGLRSRSSLDSERGLVFNILTSKPSPIAIKSAIDDPHIIGNTSFTAKLLLKIKRYLTQRLRWRYIMQAYVNKYLPYEMPILDYGACEYKDIELLNKFFMEKPISERIHFNHHANSSKSLEN